MACTTRLRSRSPAGSSRPSAPCTNRACPLGGSRGRRRTRSRRCRARIGNRSRSSSGRWAASRGRLPRHNLSAGAGRRRGRRARNNRTSSSSKACCPRHRSCRRIPSCRLRRLRRLRRPSRLNHRRRRPRAQRRARTIASSSSGVSAPGVPRTRAGLGACWTTSDTRWHSKRAGVSGGGPRAEISSFARSRRLGRSGATREAHQRVSEERQSFGTVGGDVTGRRASTRSRRGRPCNEAVDEEAGLQP